MSIRVFIAPVGAEIIQVGEPPIVATEDGVGPMLEITGIVPGSIRWTE